MFKSFKSLFAKKLAVDLGTSNTLIYTPEQGIIVNEPTVVNIQIDSSGGYRKFKAIGHAAKQSEGRMKANSTNRIINPVKNGVIYDYEITEQFLKQLFAMAHSDAAMFKKSPSPEIVLAVPSFATQIERNAIMQAAMEAGARDVLLIKESAAAALGCNLLNAESSGSMIMNIGSGTTEIAVVSRDGIAAETSLRWGGNQLNDAIIAYIKKYHYMIIDSTTAEDIKHEIGSAYPMDDVLEIELKGRRSDGTLGTCHINSNEVLEALQKPLNNTIDSIRIALENTPPALASDIYDNGLILTGGGSLLKNMDKFIATEAALKVTISDDPFTSVVKGCGIVLENPELYSDLFKFDDEHH